MAIPSGEIYLLRNVPLTATYEHTIDFKNANEQFNYFRSFIKYTLDNYTYVRRDREYISVELPLQDLDDINYLMFRSADGERLYYAFVNTKTFNNPVSSYIFYQVDVMQTYQFDYEWKASYIKQAHVDRWNAEHKPIYSKTEEDLDYGTEYSVENGFKLQQSTLIKWLLVSTTDYAAMDGHGFNTAGGTIHPAPSPFACFLVPLVLKTDENNVPYSVVTRTLTSELSIVSDYGTLIKLMTNSAFGNYVKSVTVLAYNPFIQTEELREQGRQIYVEFNDVGNIYDRHFDSSVTSANFLVIQNVKESYLRMGQTLAITDWNTGLEDSLPTDTQWEEVKKNPYTTQRDKRFESKLLCAPYRYNLLTDWRNAPIIFKNEYMTEDKITVKFSYALSYNAPFRFWIDKYKKDPEGRYTSLMQPMGLDFPVFSDAYYTYMLENKNIIQANITNSIISAGAGAASGAIGGAAVGGVAGAAIGAVTGAVAGIANVSNQIRSENAKQKDLKAVPDSVINSMDSSFNVLDNNTNVTFYRMRICCENEDIIAAIFNITGYKVNRVEIPNTRSRTRFNYIQTVGANIVGSFNQADLLEIKSIYDRGVTIWHYNAEHFKPLDYSYENIEVNLI